MAPSGGGGGARPTDEHPTPTTSSNHHHHHHNNNNNDNDVEDYLLSEETLERMLQSGHYQDDDDADDQGSFDGDDIKEELDRLAAAEEDLRNEMELVMGSFRLGSSLTTTTEEDGVVDDDDDGPTNVGEETRTSAMESVKEAEEEEEEARKTTRESPRGTPSKLDVTATTVATTSSPLCSPSSSSSSSIFRSRDASVEHRAREDYASYMRTRWRRRAEDMGVTRVGAAEEDAWYRCPLPNSVPLSSPFAAAMAHCHADYVQPLSSHALRRAHVGVAPPRGDNDNGAVSRLRASAKYDIRPPEPSPLRTSALRIRPDVLCGAVMDTLMTVVRDREGETVKRQGGHLLAVLPGVWLKKRERRRGNRDQPSSGEEAVAVAADHGEDHAHAPLKRRRRRKIWLPPACVDAQLCTKKIGGDCERVLLVRVYEMTTASSSSSNHAHHSNHHHNVNNNNNGNGLLSRRLGGGDAGSDGHSVGSVLDPDDVDDDRKYADKRDGKCVRERYSDSQDILRDAAYTIYQMDREEEEERRFAEEGDDDEDDDEEEDDDGTTATNDERNMSIRHSFSSTFHGRRSSPRQRTPSRRQLSTSLHGLGGRGAGVSGGGRRDDSDGRSSSATAGGGGLSLLGSLLASPLRALATGLQNHDHHNNNNSSSHLSSRGDASFADDRSVASLRSLPATPRNLNGGAANTTIPALSSKYANILQSAFRFLTAVISELEARGLAYTTLAYADKSDADDQDDDEDEEENGVGRRVRDGAARPPPFGAFPALPTLDAHYCSQLRLVCRETMIRKLLRSASELEQYARETERAGVAFVRLLREGVCVDYDVAPPDMPRLVPLTAYPMDFQSPEARCPPWGEEVAEALRAVREESSSGRDHRDHVDSPALAARAVRRVVDAFAAQDDAERCARMTRKNTQVVDRIAKMKAFVRESVDRVRNAHGTHRAATRAADSFRDMAGRAESPVPLSGTASLSEEEEEEAPPVLPADQVPLLKCGVSEVGADGGAGSCYVASHQMLLATRVIPIVGGSRYTLLDARRCALVVVGGRGRPVDEDDADTVGSSLRRDRSALSVRRLRTRDDDDRSFDRDPAWIMQNSDEVCSFVPSLGAARLKTFVDTVRSVAEETAAEETSTLRLTSKGGMLYDDDDHHHHHHDVESATPRV